MKKTLLTFAITLAMTITSFGQAPEGFKYQAVVRNASNVILNNQAVGMRIRVIQGALPGTVVYTETFSTNTSANGLVDLGIGTGVVLTGNFANINWAAGPYFIETAVDVSGGTSYVVMGTSQLMSVPYSLFAKRAQDVVNDQVNDADADPTNEYNTSVVLLGTDLRTTDGGGTIVTDLSSLAGGGGGNWALNGNNISNTNTGLVGIGLTTPKHTLAVGTLDSTSALAIGHIGNFNEVHSGKLVFSEDLDFAGDCGLMFQHNGSTNNLHLIGGCTAFNDTIARFNRSGSSNLRNLRVGTNILQNAINPLSVDGNSDFTGNMTITGNLTVTGNIAKGGGTFRIDHPLDPANKYLVHSFVESPEMMNVYSGNIVTDANGYATVNLPAYFEAANKDFRYQLTVIGSFAQAIVKDKIQNNSFVIQTNTPNIEVSWSVTGVRSDAYANHNRVQPEMEKELKGTYIHPELYGASKEASETARRVQIAKSLEKPETGADQ